MSPQTREQCLAAGARAYLRKPLEDRAAAQRHLGGDAHSDHGSEKVTLTVRWMLLVLLALSLPAAAQTLDKIRKSGVITLGYIDGAAPFSFTDGNGQPQGYSVELCNAVAEGVAAQLKREGLKVRWVKLTIQDRIDAVRTGKVDLECSTTTWTLSRQQLVDFSLVTFVDGGSLLVKSEAETGRLADFGGKRIAVISGTTTERSLRAALERRTVKAELVAIKTRDEGLTLLREGQVDAPRFRPHRADRRGGDERPRRAASTSCSTRTSRSSSTR